MADYMSREAAIEWFSAFAHMGEESIPTETVLDDLKGAIPAADVEPVRHVRRYVCCIDEYYGEWLQCPICGYSDNANSAKYCGGCGAKMDLED